MPKMHKHMYKKKEKLFTEPCNSLVSALRRDTSSILFQLLSFIGEVEKRMAQWSLKNRGVPQVSIIQIELGCHFKYFPADQLTAFHWITGLILQTFLRLSFK